jgi:hypothetical protein
MGALLQPTRTLKTPVRVDLAFQGPGLTAEVHHQAQLTVELHLAAGPLRLRNCKWLIVEHDMDEVLIGRPLLQSLGLDAAEHLSEVRDEYNNMDCSQIPSLTGAGKLTRLLLRDQEIEPKSLPAPKVLAKSAQLDSVTYGELGADPVEVPQLLDLPASVSSDTISTELENMVSTAQKNGIWSTSLQAGPPATLPPLVIRLKPDAVPVRVRLRRNSQEQHDFLALFVKTLEEAGMVYRNPSAAWCSAPLLVPKPGPAQFRFTVDLRSVNKQTIPCSWPMPHVESELSRLQSSKFFATFDLSHGYWQLPLAPESQECQSFITPDGVYSPTRVLHGTTNAVPNNYVLITTMHYGTRKPSSLP